MADWTTISALATAGGTLVLAGATFASVRSANRAARVAEQSLLAGLRPLLIPSRLEDPSQKVTFMEGNALAVPGGGGVAQVGDGAVFLVISLRNAGSGVAVLHGWHLWPERRLGRDGPLPPDEFTRLTRDLYIPLRDTGFWQGSFRDPASPAFAEAKQAIETRQPMSVDILYGDFEGGQRVITRFGLLPREDRDGWLAVVVRHWNVDREDPR
jgi:hypothetical protein